MSITTKSNDYRTNEETVTVEYVGRVLKSEVRAHRVMSDIYADVLFVTVVKDDGSTMNVHAKSYFECDTRSVSVTNDLAPEWKNLMEAFQSLKAAERCVVECDSICIRDSENAVANFCAPKRGEKIVVTRKGKNVKNGETGVCFWVGQSKYDNSMRVGFISDEDGVTKKYIGLGSCRHINATKEALNSIRAAVKEGFKTEKDKAVNAYEIALAKYNEVKTVTHWISLGTVPTVTLPSIKTTEKRSSVLAGYTGT